MSSVWSLSCAAEQAVGPIWLMNFRPQAHSPFFLIFHVAFIKTEDL